MPSPKLFISHAAADQPLVEAFETLVCKMTGLASDRIFCSVLEGQGVPKGSNFVDHIRDEVEQANAVIALITPAYLDSAFCMAELGAAWVLQTQRFPIAVPPIGVEAIDATQLGLAAVKVDDADALAQLFDDLIIQLGITRPKAGVQRRALSGFMAAWDVLRSELPGPQRVSYQEHQALQEERNSLTKELGDSDAEISRLENMVAQLRAAKDRTEVEAIDASFADTDLEVDYRELIATVQELADEVGGWPVLQHAILDFYDRAGRVDWQNYETEFETAVQHGIYDPEDNSLKWGSDELSALGEGLKRIDSFLLENSGALFLTDDDKRGPADPRFWRGR